MVYKENTTLNRNCFQSEFKLEVKDFENQEICYEIYQLNGVMLQNGKINQHENLNHQLQKGIYLIKIKNGNSWQSKKLIIE